MKKFSKRELLLAVLLFATFVMFLVQINETRRRTELAWKIYNNMMEYIETVPVPDPPVEYQYGIHGDSNASYQTYAPSKNYQDGMDFYHKYVNPYFKH